MNAKKFKSLFIVVLAMIIITATGSLAFAETNMNQLQLAARGETKAEADNYSSSISEGVEKTIASVPAKKIATVVPKAQIKADKEIKDTVFRERIPDYSLSDIKSLDLRKPSCMTADDLKATGTFSGLSGLEDSFVKAEEDYGVNCVFLYSIACVESSGGTAMFKPNNMFGYGQKSFSSKAECIDYVARHISEDYLNENGSFYTGPTPADVNKIYCTTHSWHTQVEKIMYQMYKKARELNLAKYGQ